MTPNLQAFVADLSEFQINQTLGVGKPNQKLGNHLMHNAPFEFEIQNSKKEVIGIAQEEEKDSLAPFWIKSYYLKGHRAMTLKISNESYEPIMYLNKNHAFFSTSLIYNENQEPLASITRRFHPFIKKYDFHGKTPRKELMAFIHAPITKPWTFPIYKPRKRKIGTIKKLFPSIGQALSYRETLKVQCEKISPEEKIMVLSASLIISIEHFNS